MSVIYIYPSNLDAGGRDVAIAFDEQEVESLVKILKKEDGPIAESLLQMLEDAQNDWACFSFGFHGRFNCDNCGKGHIGVKMAGQYREFLIILLIEKYPDHENIIKKLKEKPISYLDPWMDGEMLDEYTNKHRYSQKRDEYIIPNDSYLSSSILFPLVTYYQKCIEEQKGEKQYCFDMHTAELYLVERHGKYYQEFQNRLDAAEQILKKCKTGGERISLTKDERSWLRNMLEDKRKSIDMWRDCAATSTQYDEMREEGRFELYHLHKCLRSLYPDRELLYDVEDKINEIVDRYHYSKLDASKISQTFVSSVFKLGEHITKGSQCENRIHDTVNYEIKRREYIAKFESRFKDRWPFEQDRGEEE